MGQLKKFFLIVHKIGYNAWSYLSDIVSLANRYHNITRRYLYTEGSFADVTIVVPLLTRSDVASLCRLSLPDADSPEGPGIIVGTGVPGIDEIGEAIALPLRLGWPTSWSTKSR